MEWVLQVVDEIDDAIGVVRHGWLGLTVQTGTLLGAMATSTAAMLGSAARVRISMPRMRS